MLSLCISWFWEGTPQQGGTKTIYSPGLCLGWLGAVSEQEGELLTPSKGSIMLRFLIILSSLLSISITCTYFSTVNLLMLRRRGT